MKAISPVIATLILIAIAVIAGVFVLRQFLSFASTSGQQDVLAIQDAYLTVVHKSNGMTVYLQITLKNQGDKVINVTNITVDGKRLLTFTYATINPGADFTYTDVVLVNATSPVITDPTTQEQWESGTEHLVVVTYDVIGGNSGQQVSQQVRAV